MGTLPYPYMSIESPDIGRAEKLIIRGGNVYPGNGVTSSGQIKFKFKGISSWIALCQFTNTKNAFFDQLFSNWNQLSIHNPKWPWQYRPDHGAGSCPGSYERLSTSWRPWKSYGLNNSWHSWPDRWFGFLASDFFWSGTWSGIWAKRKTIFRFLVRTMDRTT